MNYKKAYCHMFNQVTELINLLDTIQETGEKINVTALLKALQSECEDICISDLMSLHKASRRGGS